MFYLYLKRVYLRYFIMSDLLDLYEYCSNPYVGPNAGWAPHKNIDESRNILVKLINNKECFAIVDTKTNKVIGSIGLYKDFKREHPNCRMIGYVLNPLFWGKGIMCEVVNGLIDYLFKNTSLTLLSVYHFAWNLKSKRVIEKCGFKYEGIIRGATILYDGSIVDNMCYSLSKEEYKQNINNINN